MVKIKRVYEPANKSDGYRVLVDRLWPRGIRKADLSFDEWPKELSPSADLRKSFGHDPLKFHDFRLKYKKELRKTSVKKKINELAQLAQKENVTLLYAAHDKNVNHAVVLKEVIDKA